ncbi:hypothetical protein PANO111632_18915 [Paracoccus nototheniae]|uniref:Flagellar assembly protein FliH/Type III secretion system HrpE domain-containing protein n=1 Tax=Paracoccus nototheniae TaxID=2489002 RepID=A0ABW4DUW2_9RHOB|nr:hypothetical protein [Paracoccus nototheniae]
MTLAMFKLESFSAPPPGRVVEVTYSRDDLDQAFAQGQSLARAEAEDAGLRALGEGLDRLAESLSDDEARRHQLRQEAVAALAPILHQILDLMAPSRSSHRLEEALLTELEILAQRSAPLSARIACSDRLRPMVDYCLIKSGLAGILIDEISQDCVTLTLQGGRIDFVPDDIARDIRALMAEINQEDS